MIDLTTHARLERVRRSLRDTFSGYASPPSRSPVHRWYVLNMAYSHRVVQAILTTVRDDRAKLTVIDPFCGSGTTLVEARAHGHAAIGVDANPVCVFFSQVKTRGRWSARRLEEAAEQVEHAAESAFQRRAFLLDGRYESILQAGLVERGWISSHKLGRVVSLLIATDELSLSAPYGALLRAAVVAATRETIADIRFGPELTCLATPRRTHAFSAFRRKVRDIAEDHAAGALPSTTRGRVMEGDARELAELCPVADMVITSPPYPTDHDYARNTRLELHLLGHVLDKQDLRSIKQAMVRCSTKSVYADDTDGELVAGDRPIQDLVWRLMERSRHRTDGFARVAPVMLQHYFGGMLRHMRSMARVLRPGGLAAYVIADHQSFSGVYVDAPGIVERLATEYVGLRSHGRITVGRRRGTTGTRELAESVLLLSR